MENLGAQGPRRIDSSARNLGAQVGAHAGAQVGFDDADAYPASVIHASLDELMGANLKEAQGVGQIAADRDVLLRVMARAQLSQDRLARECNVQAGYMSRVLSGQFPVTFAIFRAAWSLTRDDELLRLLDLEDRRVAAISAELIDTFNGVSGAMLSAFSPRATDPARPGAGQFDARFAKSRLDVLG